MRARAYLLPLPPSTNGLFLNIPGKGRVKSAAYKRWVGEAGWTLLSQRPSKVAGRVGIRIRVKRMGNRKADLDNRIKATIDLLVSHGIIEDDRHVESVTASWADELTGVEVIVEPMETTHAN